MYGRFLDKISLYNYYEDKTFKKRNHGQSLFALSCQLVSVFILISSLLMTSEHFSEWQLMALLFIILSTFGFFIAKSFKKYEMVLNIIEFQNSLFASVAKISAKLCLIIKEDGNIVYISPEYKEMFSEEVNNLDQFCSNMGINQNFKDILLNAIKYKKNETIDFSSNSFSKKNKFKVDIHPIETDSVQDTLNLTFNPVKYHSGYFFLKVNKDIKQKSTSDLLDELNIASYSILSKDDKLISMNKKFSELLGYNKISSIVNSEEVFNKEEREKIFSAENLPQGIYSIKKENNKIFKSFLYRVVTKEKKENHTLVIPLDENTIPVLKSKNDDFVAEDIVNNLPVATIIMDEDKNTIYCNKIFKSLFSMNDSISKFNFIEDIVDESDKDKINNVMKNISEQNTEQKPLDIKIHHPGIASVSLYVMKSENNFICSLVDITELKNLEQRFSHSQKMQAIGQLAGGIAHDFNNLLTAIIGFCDLLLMRHAPGDSSFVEIMQIKQNGNRAAALVGQLMAFSRKQTLQPKVINITGIIADLSTLLERLIGENIELVMKYEKDFSYARIDKGQFEQVIMNLVVNARDAMPEGGKLIIGSKSRYIKTEEQLGENMFKQEEDNDVFEPGNYVVIDVIDDGLGIPDEIVEKIFEPFFSTKEIGYGTGLGLSTVYGIVKQMEGHIYLFTKEGEGTRFTILLKSCLKEENIVKKENIVEKPVNLQGKANILLIEDETPVRIFTTRALSVNGYNVIEACNGEEAIKYVEEKGDTLDLIITDVIMPGMNGVSTVEEISRKYPEIKVIFISGYSKNELLRVYDENKAFNFLAKPYTLVELSKKIKEVLNTV